MELLQWRTPINIEAESPVEYDTDGTVVVPTGGQVLLSFASRDLVQEQIVDIRLGVSNAKENRQNE